MTIQATLQPSAKGRCIRVGKIRQQTDRWSMANITDRVQSFFATALRQEWRQNPKPVGPSGLQQYRDQL